VEKRKGKGKVFLEAGIREKAVIPILKPKIVSTLIIHKKT
jgi:hypothetical protein